MSLADMGISGTEFLVIICALIAVVAIGHYGRETALGYTGSVLLCLVVSPLIGFTVVYYLRSKTLE